MARHHLAVGVALALLGCGPQAEDVTGDSEGSAGQAVCAITTVDPARSLLVLDQTALANFSFQTVLAQVAATGGNDGETAMQLWSQLVDTTNDKAHAVTSGPHCDDGLVNGKPSLNGFPIECPRPEGQLATVTPFNPVNQHDPNTMLTLALVNRFDLAPKNGANCGQYRIIFGRQAFAIGQGNDRLFYIFEAVLPNPTPSAGLAGCLPIAQFWDALSADGSATHRASQLQKFFFTGINGIPKVIDAKNYGFGGGTNTGQIRGNLFVSDPNWSLREYRTSQTCKSGKCSLVVKPAPVRTNPSPALFSGTDATSLAFQADFITRIPGLAAGKDLFSIKLGSPLTYSSGESIDSQQVQDYDIASQSNAAFRNQIAAKLVAMKRTDLSVDQVLNRATTQACAGCHAVSDQADLGDMLAFPSVGPFTMVDERQFTAPFVQLSLPQRAQVLFNYLTTTCAAQPVVDDGLTLGGSAVGAAN
jgi:hypothetical protein